jgi:hypothetical protein
MVKFLGLLKFCTFRLACSYPSEQAEAGIFKKCLPVPAA